MRGSGVSSPSGSPGPGRSASGILLLGGVVLLLVGGLLVGSSLRFYIASRLFSPSLHRVVEAVPAERETTNGQTQGPTPRPVRTATWEPLWEPSYGLEQNTTQPQATSFTAPVILSPTRILIPSIGVDAEVVPTSWQVVEVEGSLRPVWTVPDPPLAGWHEGSAPLGVPGNTVISGHNWPENAVFRDLYLVEPGERVVLYAGDTPFVYGVTEVHLLEEAGQPLEVRLENARYALPTDDERVTLITCHPYGSLAFRLIVVARPEEALPPDFMGK